MDTQPKKESENAVQHSGGLFRKAALSRLTAGEHVDELLQVSRPSDWIITSTLAGMGIIAIAWAFFGRVPVMVDGQGLLQPKDGIAKIIAQQSGTVQSEPPVNGTAVEKGDLVVKIYRDVEIQQLKDAIEKERLAKREYEVHKRTYSERIGDSEIIKLMKDNIPKLEKLCEDKKRSYIKTKELHKMKYVTDTQLLAAEQAATGSLQSLHEARIQLVKEQMLEKTDLIQAEGRYLDTQQQCKEIRQSLKESEYYAPISGNISELTLKRGVRVPANTPICLITGKGPAILVYLFFATEDAKRIRAGQEARISVSGYPSDTYGKLLGKVTAVEMLPASSNLIEESCSYSETLTKQLLSGKPVNRVSVILKIEGKGKELTYKKTSVGQSFTITSGMICLGSIVIEEQVPITLIIPALKRWFGITTFE